MDRGSFDAARVVFNGDPRFPVQEIVPLLTEDVGDFDYDAHYVLHTAWAARVLAETRPERHTDISSYVYFVAMVSAFVPIDFYELRPVYLPLSNVTNNRADLMHLPFPDNSIKSLSCMHTLEHVGLGRYGDEIHRDGDIMSAHEMQRVLAPGGDLLIVTPVGRPKLVFNSHRTYAYEQILAMFPALKVHEFALIPNDGPKGKQVCTQLHKLVRNAAPAMVANQEFACGCFWFKKE